MRFIKFVSIARSTPLYIRQVPDTAVIATMPQRQDKTKHKIIHIVNGILYEEESSENLPLPYRH